MKIRIYQINMDRDTNRIAFCGLDQIKKYFGITEVDSKIYDMVYEGNTSCSTLDEVYEMFNLNHPEDFKGWSLSVSDVVEIIESEGIQKGFYFCDSYGFTNISFDSENCEVR